MRLSDFREALKEELGEQLYEIVGDGAFERWINAGQRRLGSYLRKRITLAWVAGDDSISLPSDFHHSSEWRGDIPAGSEWGTEYVFDTPATSAGSVALRYFAHRPNIAGATESTLDSEGDEALISYALYRFFKRLASSRSDYRMYATITQANGVDIAELDAVSERHLQDFKDVADQLTPLDATIFYAD